MCHAVRLVLRANAPEVMLAALSADREPQAYLMKATTWLSWIPANGLAGL